MFRSTSGNIYSSGIKSSKPVKPKGGEWEQKLL